ncbi:MAG TPA: hypothetical protein VFW65_12230 [Pseudonocardiaceae bacterium]|nr:hypothetical protein [Pseudonocardiaceae bacterium]
MLDEVIVPLAEAAMPVASGEYAQIRRWPRIAVPERDQDFAAVARSTDQAARCRLTHRTTGRDARPDNHDVQPFQQGVRHDRPLGTGVRHHTSRSNTTPHSCAASNPRSGRPTTAAHEPAAVAAASMISKSLLDPSTATVDLNGRPPAGNSAATSGRTGRTGRVARSAVAAATASAVLTAPGARRSNAACKDAIGDVLVTVVIDNLPQTPCTRCTVRQGEVSGHTLVLLSPLCLARQVWRVVHFGDVGHRTGAAQEPGMVRLALRSAGIAPNLE